MKYSFSFVIFLFTIVLFILSISDRRTLIYASCLFSFQWSGYIFTPVDSLTCLLFILHTKWLVSRYVVFLN